MIIIDIDYHLIAQKVLLPLDHINALSHATRFHNDVVIRDTPRLLPVLPDNFVERRAA